MTLHDLRAYLAEQLELANKYDVEANAENIAARIWKRLTPEALSMWTVSGVLEHIAQCLAPPDVDEDEDE